MREKGIEPIEEDVDNVLRPVLLVSSAPAQPNRLPSSPQLPVRMASSPALSSPLSRSPNPPPIFKSSSTSSIPKVTPNGKINFSTFAYQLQMTMRKNSC